MGIKWCCRTSCISFSAGSMWNSFWELTKLSLLIGRHIISCSASKRLNLLSYLNLLPLNQMTQYLTDILLQYRNGFEKVNLYCTMLSDKWSANFFQGITNTIGAIPGIVGVALTGYLLDLTDSWSVSSLSFTTNITIRHLLFSLSVSFLIGDCITQMSLFAPSIFFYLTGTVVWLAFASSKPQNFS